MIKRRWILWLLTAALIWVVTAHYGQLHELGNTILRGRWEWVMMALVIQVLYYLAFTGTYKAAFQSAGVHSRLRELVPVTLGAFFLNVVAPVGGSAGAALFVDDAARRDESPARALGGVYLQIVADLGSFSVIMVAGLGYLFIRHDLKAYEIVSALILLGITLAWSGVLLLAAWRVRWLRRILKVVQRAAGWVAGRLPHFSARAGDWAQHSTDEFIRAAQTITRRRKNLAGTLAIAFTAHLINAACLYAVILAFYQPVSLGMLVAGYSISVLFRTVSPTPQGVGVVEGVMALVYTSLGMPGAVATSIALVFRGLTFWLAFGLGFLALRRLEVFSD